MTVSCMENLRPSGFDALCIAAAIGIVVLWLPTPTINSDSWTYFEISRSVFTDFYRINTVRQFETTSLYSTSFPPLYPCLLACAQLVFDFGIYTGILLNAAFCVATLFVAKSLVRAVGLPVWVANLLFLAVLFRPTYVTELMAAKAIPLSVLLIVCLLRGYVAPWACGPGRAIVLGLLAGLAVLNRFDFTIAAAFLGVVLAWYTRQRDWRIAPAYYAAWGLAVSPWIIYSLWHFNVLFATDNARTAWLVFDSNVVHYYPHHEPLDYLWDRPGTWISNVLTRRLPWVLGGCFRTSITDPTLIVLAGVLLGMRLEGAARVAPAARPNDRPAVAPVSQWLGFALVFAVQLLTIGLTGYADLRYHLAFQFFLSLVLMHAIGARVDLNRVVAAWPKFRLRAVALCGTAAVALLAVTPVVSHWAPRAAAARLDQFELFKQDLLTAKKYDDLLAALGRDDEPRVLIVSGIDAFEFGAKTGCVTLYEPHNLTAETIAPFLKDYAATHVLDTEGEWANLWPASVAQAPTDFPGLVRVLSADSPSPVTPSAPGGVGPGPASNAEEKSD